MGTPEWESMDQGTLEMPTIEKQLKIHRAAQFAIADEYIDRYLDGDLPFRDVRQVLTRVKWNLSELDDQYLTVLTTV